MAYPGVTGPVTSLNKVFGVRYCGNVQLAAERCGVVNYRVARTCGQIFWIRTLDRGF